MTTGDNPSAGGDRPLGSTGMTTASGSTTSPGGAGMVPSQGAGGVSETAKESGGKVVETAKEQAKTVTGEARDQARNVMREAQTAVREQAGTQQQKAAGGLRNLGQELRSMAGSPEEQSGPAAELARQAADKAQQFAAWLEAREPGDLAEELRALARRRPGMFLLGAAAAGVVAGRLTRGAVQAARSSDDGGGTYEYRGAHQAPRATVQPTTAAGMPPSTGARQEDEVLVVSEPVPGTTGRGGGLQ